MSYKTKAELETQKLELLHKIRFILSFFASDLTDDEDKIISRAMDYVVKSHSSIDEQYIRITEYILAIDGMECRVTRTCTNSSSSFTTDYAFDSLKFGSHEIVKVKDTTMPNGKAGVLYRVVK